MQRPRVVITGLGAITALGSSVAQFWEGLINGKSGVRRITKFDPSDLPCQIAGEIPDFDAEEYISRKETRRMARSAQIAFAAATQAVTDSGLPEPMDNPERSSVLFGTSIGGLDMVDKGIQQYRTEGLKKINPFALPAGIPNLSAFYITKKYQCLGPNITISTACATGTQAVGEASELIRRGVSDIVVTGGSEALIMDIAIAGFCSMRALPLHFNDRPEMASRPFDADREGFVFAEGAGSLILENLDHALKRGANIYAEVVGHSSSVDGYHIAAPHPDAIGPINAIRWALKDANISPTDIEYINAHGTSTPLNGITETKAIKKVFGDHAYELAISSNKSMIGHAMGASGVLEAIATALTIKHSIIPPTINYQTPDPDCDLDYVPNEMRKKDVNYALSNSFGLGGQNACLILKKYN
jgi:beta-ketoacyl-acyl-carrier-protein synthase II